MGFHYTALSTFLLFSSTAFISDGFIDASFSASARFTLKCLCCHHAILRITSRTSYSRNDDLLSTLTLGLQSRGLVRPAFSSPSPPINSHNRIRCYTLLFYGIHVGMGSWYVLFPFLLYYAAYSDHGRVCFGTTIYFPLWPWGLQSRGLVSSAFSSLSNQFRIIVYDVHTSTMVSVVWDSKFW